MATETKRPGRPKGHPKTGGRKKGSPNKVTLEIREAARALVEDPEGQQTLLLQYRKGNLNPSVLQMLYHYAYGKPKDTLELKGGIAIAKVARVIIAGRADAQD